MTSPLRRRALWTLLAGAFLALFVATAWSRRWGATRPAAPPVLGSVPGFALTNRDGRAIELADLQGRPWVGSFIFTRCGGACPRITDQMVRLGVLVRHPQALRRVSITVDPEYDTAPVLASYAAARGIDDPEWLFLTGDAAAVSELVREGFKLGVGPGETPEEPIFHSNRLVLVDAAGRIRGYYDAFDEAAVGRLLDDLRAVERAG
jgi:protein SCO1/2